MAINPNVSKAARYLSAFIFIGIGLWWGSAILVSPKPVFVATVASVFFVISFGLIRNLFWSRHISVIFLFTISPFMTLLWLPSKQGNVSLSTTQNFVAQLNLGELWCFYMVIVILNLGLAYLLSQSKTQFYRKWI
ncbi:hypothetical protein K6Y31_06080 [Motilimonas cestriensis]|uniref:Uncharacterized protein n=1 Tax=Motilimonas cestriensis TaxID=2742685 RepID=A0ABS8W9I5_9GAMM|nr:hypothetical protein [Motilimonas cestriensis]MCE2594378.1 hypothetical protein [Motilimonas cestriensis]